MKEKQQKSTLAWLMEWASPHRSGYIASVVLAILGVACSIVPYFAVAKILTGLLAGDRDLSVYLSWIAACALAWTLRILFHSVSTTFSHKATFAVIAEVRRRLTAKLTRLPMGMILDTPSGEFKNIIVEKTDSIETTLAHILPEMTSNLLVPLGIIVYLFAVDWRMALISLVTFPIGLACFGGMKKDYARRYGNYVAKNKKLNATAVEYIGGIEVIKAFNQSAASYEKFTTAAREAAASAIDWMKQTQVYFAAALAIFPAVLVGVLPLGCVFYRNGSLSAPDFIQAVILALGIMPPLITAFSYQDDLAKIGTIVGDIASVLTKEELMRPTAPVPLSGYDIVLDDVCFGYGKKQVLEHVSLTIRPGTVTALVGPSGGGKSTVAKLIDSLWDVDSGSIRIGGVNVRRIPLEQLNDSIAYVSQDNYLFDDTVRNNIRMGKKGATDAEVEAAAKASGCHNFIMQLDNGYETVVGGAGGHLSGGERQRVAIARAMLKNAPVVILDEATSYTDPENEAVIQSAVAKLVQGKTLVVIAHRLSTITDSDQIVVIRDGAVQATGTHDGLLKGCPLYRDMWAAHIGVRDSSEEGSV